ncbi:MAG: 5-formyltetrahydrofolate cyclo-ligase [Lachnospiraceae bacterium]|nr:5-formyltetrahydrofolate cyclo-ligase [Lachnospiraceae bacterium]
MEKKEIRKLVFARRKEMSQQELEEKSKKICETVIGMKEFREASAIYVYMDYNGEAMTGDLIREAWKQGKKVAAPKVEGSEMSYYYISSYEDVKPGYFSIPEPEPVNPACDEDALLIVPGVAFDDMRHRCGYGKGFYDRYLSSHREHPTIAIALEMQMMEEVPSDVHDICPMYLVTEDRVISG